MAKLQLHLSILFVSSIFFAFGLKAQETFSASPVCGFGDVRIDTDFSTGRINDCAKTGRNEYTLSVSPENKPINPSPWYAFKISSVKQRSVVIYLHYGHHLHRYKPKTSLDGKNWTLLNNRSWDVQLEGKVLKLTLKIGPKPLYIAGQEIVDNDSYESWIDNMSLKPSVQKILLGPSTEGRPIYKLESKSGGGKRGQIVVIGRQHPPEVTGALALKKFVERLWADDPLALAFQSKFNLLVVPNLNPDGVEHGHWRHNVKGIDLNRDWGPFTQKETQLMRDELAKFKEPGAPKMHVFLDFHSTNRNVLYTQFDTQKSFLPQFTRRWHSAINQHLPSNKIERKPGNNSEKPTSKAYVYAQFGVPAITFELGDETDRALISNIATVAAEEMMHQLLVSNEK